MIKRKFKLSHSIAGLIFLLLVQALFVYLWPVAALVWLVLVCSVAGAALVPYVATEVIKDVRNIQHMLILLCVVVAEFVIFFAFEYGYLAVLSPNSFPELAHDWVSLLLHSTMIFVFNPLYVPADFAGRLLLLINTGGALVLVLFILQNIWQFRRV